MPPEPKNLSLDEIRNNVSKMLDSSDPESPISATVVFKVKKESEETFKTNANELTAATRELDGCKRFRFSRHLPYEGEPPDDNSVEYLIDEEWETVRQFKVQWNSPH